MREVMTEMDAWLAAGRPVALATVLATWGSAPRKVGAVMAFTAEGQIAGSVSGGCVEGAVYEAGLEVLHSGRPQRLTFGVADETAWDVGLACGGQLEVFVEQLAPTLYTVWRGWIAQDRPGALATVVEGPAAWLGLQAAVAADGTLAQGTSWPELDACLLTAAQRQLAAGASGSITLEQKPEVRIFVNLLLPAPSLILVGGVHIAIALAQIARTLGYRITIIDPRRAFGTPERFPQVDALWQLWPDKAFSQLTLNENTAVVLLTHDPKIDDPALKLALPSPAFYVGALGSSRTHARRVERLTQAGLPPAQIARIHAPIGLDIQAQTPEEIAVAIMAEIIAVRRHGRSLSRR